jgi:hypothetical protein
MAAKAIAQMDEQKMQEVVRSLIYLRNTASADRSG